MTVWKLFTSSLKMFVRNKQAMIFTLISPLLIMAVFGLLAFDRVPKINIGVVVNAPPTAGTSQFINQLKDVPAFDVHVGSEMDERAALDEGDRSAVFLIPSDLFPEGSPSGTKTITALSNAGDAQQASTAISILNQILDKTTLQIAGAPQLFSLDVQSVNSRNLKYIDFLVPGVVALSIMQMAVFSVAFVFVDYKEKGVFKRLLATPMKPYQFVSANVATRLVIAVVQAAFLVGVGVLAFNAQVIGSYLLLVPIVVLGAIMFIGLGFTISGFARTVEAVPAIANLVVFPMLFLGGTFFPIDTMPTWLQNIASYLPLTYLSNALREVMIEGAGFKDIQSNLLWMAAWSILLIITSNLSFSFEEKRQ